MSKMLDAKQAYKAMFYFLEQLYFEQGFSEFGELLGSMNILEDGKPADAALWTDWEKALDKIVNEEE